MKVPEVEGDMMKKRILSGLSIIFICLFIYSSLANARDIEPIKLLPPELKVGKLLMQALKDRESRRDFSPEEIPLQTLSNLLWAANGINRPAIQHKTAPSAMNMQEIDIYVARKDGLYLFDAENNTLEPILMKNIMAVTGKQAFVEDAPINLIFVADFSKMSRLSGAEKDFYAAIDTGYISQNVYLFCASGNLATVARGWIDKPALAKAMNLRPDQKVILAQTVGYPKK